MFITNGWESKLNLQCKRYCKAYNTTMIYLASADIKNFMVGVRDYAAVNSN